MTDRLNLKRARLVDENGAYQLALTIGRKRVALLRETHEPFVRAGLVSLGSDFPGLTPREVEVEPGRTDVFEGFTDDPRVFKLFMDYVAWCDGDFDRLTVGADIPIPEV